jgi:hypothetical protein
MAVLLRMFCVEPACPPCLCLQASTSKQALLWRPTQHSSSRRSSHCSSRCSKCCSHKPKHYNNNNSNSSTLHHRSRHSNGCISAGYLRRRLRHLPPSHRYQPGWRNLPTGGSWASCSAAVDAAAAAAAAAAALLTSRGSSRGSFWQQARSRCR